MALKSGIGGSRPSKARNPEEMMREQLLMMSKGLDAISEKDLSGGNRKHRKEDSKKQLSKTNKNDEVDNPLRTKNKEKKESKKPIELKH